jgi:hypothetical protein
VLRGGYGFFYDRLGSGNLLTINRANVQNQIVLNDPICTASATSLNAIDMSTCSKHNRHIHGFVAGEVRGGSQLSFALHGQAGASIERQLFSGTSATLTYLHSLGVHQVVTRNANQATGGTPQKTLEADTSTSITPKRSSSRIRSSPA